MSTNEERRVIAHSLRKNANSHSDMPLILNVAFSAFGFNGCSDKTVTAREAAFLLADLIEPEEPEERTCYDFGGKVNTFGEYHGFACSNCGFCNGMKNPNFTSPNYCPNCGAKVVE